MNNVIQSPILSCHQLSKKFVEGENAVQVLQQVDFAIYPGEMVAIIGVSGSGKSTLLHLLGGLDTPTSGHVMLEQQNLTTLSEKQKSRLRNRKLGFVYQFHHLLPEFSALENVCMPLLIQGLRGKEAIEKALAIIESIELSHRIHHRVGELSGGERQRIAIARALVTRPLCVLADEPTGNLDHQTSEHVFTLMQKLNKTFHTSFVIVTHNEVLANQMDKVFVLEKGQLQVKS
jgi:lipoprotein-releasing system ATP-binding protein